MNTSERIDLLRHVLGASHVFSTAVNELLERTLAEVSGGQLALSQVKLLLLIGRPRRRFKVTDVAEFLGVTNAAASRSIERLVQRGLIDRTISRSDRRAVDLSLTPAGEDLLERFTDARNREMLSLLEHYPERKLQTIAKLLDEVAVELLHVHSGSNERCLRCGIHFRSSCVLKDVLGRECAVATALYGDTQPEKLLPAGTER